MDALSSAAAMKVNRNLQLTLMASSQYRLLAGRIGRGYDQAKSRHRFRDFVEAKAKAKAKVRISESEIVVQFQNHAHDSNDKNYHIYVIIRTFLPRIPFANREGKTRQYFAFRVFGCSRRRENGWRIS
jgi:hypothetical protein